MSHGLRSVTNLVKSLYLSRIVTLLGHSIHGIYCKPLIHNKTTDKMSTPLAPCLLYVTIECRTPRIIKTPTKDLIFQLFDNLIKQDETIFLLVKCR